MTLTQLSSPKTPPELTAAKFTDLHSLMAVHQLDGYFIPAVDEHLNLSVPEAKQRRAWLSGFNGSAGDLLVLADTAWLFVDSRYHEQADLQVEPSLIQVCKLGKEGHLTLLATLERLAQTAANNQRRFRLGFDPFTLSLEQFQTWIEQLSFAHLQLLPVAENLIDLLRHQSPWNELDPILPVGESPLFELPFELTGETASQKLARVREWMSDRHLHFLPITNLNQIAWLFNLRGEDLPYIPVFIAYAILTLETAFLFTNLTRIPTELQQQLLDNVTLMPYEEYPETLKLLVAQQSNSRILLDPKHTTTGTYQILLTEQSQDEQEDRKIFFDTHPLEAMKACKNAVEIEQIKTANLKASRAKLRTLKWVSNQLDSGKNLSELDVAVAIERFYREEAKFQGLSFATIAAIGGNGAIVHYKNASSDAELKPGSLLLLDSGAQFIAGTTDDTRTIIIGEPTPLQIERYTAVLIAHINCAMQQFPKGTTGMQLDAVARSSLWQFRLDYGHGTGHGVGHFLSGHEGPFALNKLSQYPLVPGMVTSIEPGYYESGWGGIRLENLYVIKEVATENGTSWYGFEPLTYIPFAQKLIDFNRLTPQQHRWLQQYNTAVLEKLAPTLEPTEVQWLKQEIGIS